jgi:hypothetical protein
VHNEKLIVDSMIFLMIILNYYYPIKLDTDSIQIDSISDQVKPCHSVMCSSIGSRCRLVS